MNSVYTFNQRNGTQGESSIRERIAGVPSRGVLWILTKSDSSAPENVSDQIGSPIPSPAVSVWNDAAGWPLPADLRVPWDWVDLVILALLAFVSVVFVIPLFLVKGFSMAGIGRAQLSSSVADQQFTSPSSIR